MGLTLDQLQSGFTDVSKLVSTGMDTWDRVKQSIAPTTTATSPIAAAPTGSAVTPTAQTTSSPPSATGFLAGVPKWALFGGAGLVLYLMLRGR